MAAIGWASSLSASLGVRNLPGLPVYANIFQLLPHIEGIVPVSVVAYNDNFIVGADLFWVRLGLIKGGPGPFGVNAGLTHNETLATAYGGVRIPTVNPDLPLARRPLRLGDLSGRHLGGP